ncbi:hypothetical protein [Thermoanaerobacterium sp. RBIITD]|uniref:hypothetical protein n=1 Tax=Thermoanaerobacterium sp. RBIITD TaxID=1550240 RepID=UPI000BB7DB62|nr:hypothetical protein [Thermoanaerobacterium sp. RBIITD]SNX54990.1 hypothetical protein SAMN05660242_2763 [Thermoanaerobacterium sp. RBIITD]
MSFAEILKTNKMTLIVSLPKNTIELAQAAMKGGADALKVHANVHHQASGNDFGSIDEQREVFREIINSFKVPVGLVPGAETCADRKEIKLAEELKFSFLSMFAHHMPLYMLDSNLEKMVAVNEVYDISHIKALNKINIDVIEADVLPDDRREKIHLSDLMRYGRLVENLTKPVVVPTQRIIEPDEVKYLYDLGIKGIMIGAIVTRNDTEGVLRMTESFKNEINKL